MDPVLVAYRNCVLPFYPFYYLWDPSYSLLLSPNNIIFVHSFLFFVHSFVTWGSLNLHWVKHITNSKHKMFSCFIYSIYNVFILVFFYYMHWFLFAHYLFNEMFLNLIKIGCFGTHTTNGAQGLSLDLCSRITLSNLL